MEISEERWGQKGLPVAWLVRQCLMFLQLLFTPLHARRDFTSDFYGANVHNSSSRLKTTDATAYAPSAASVARTTTGFR